MQKSSLAGTLTTPKVDVGIDMGNAFLNHTVDGNTFLRLMLPTRTVAEDTCNIVGGGNFSRHFLEHADMSTDDTENLKDATIGGALTEGLVTAVGNNNRDEIVTDAVTGCAAAAAAEFLRCHS